MLAEIVLMTVLVIASLFIIERSEFFLEVTVKFYMFILSLKFHLNVQTSDLTYDRYREKQQIIFEATQGLVNNDSDLLRR